MPSRQQVRVLVLSAVLAAALAAGIVVAVLAVRPPSGRREAAGITSTETAPLREMRVPEWELPDSTELLYPPILMIRSDSGPWSRSEIEPFMYDSVEAVREHLRRENVAALRRLFARVP